MAFQAGTANNMNDLLTQLSTFAVTGGWTQDQYTPEAGATDGKFSLHKNGVFVHFAWNSSESPSIAVYQSLGFISAGTDIWDHTDDSGQGTATVPSTSSAWNADFWRNRFISEIGIGPYTSYAFFLGNGVDEYIHVVLEYAPFTYRHFGFGELEKAWDFTGGEYCYGHTQRISDPKDQGYLLRSGSSASGSEAERNPSMHVEGLPAQVGSGKWGIFDPFTALGVNQRDRALVNQVRLVGGVPGGPIGSHFNNLPSNAGDGFLPLSGNAIFYRDVVPSPDKMYFMGFQPDIRSLNMRNFVPKDEVVIGSDTWKIYPAVRKQNIGSKNESENFGIAYKKII